MHVLKALFTRKGIGGVAVAAAGAAVMLFGSAGIASADVTQVQSIPVAQQCTGDGQVCAPVFTTSVQTSGTLRVNFTASNKHCSDIRVRIFTDPSSYYTAGPLGPGQSTGWFLLGPVPAGIALVNIEAEGIVGGCNSGQLSSWGGTLRVETSVATSRSYHALSVNNCYNQGGQMCFPAQLFPVTTGGVLRARFTAAPTHCSSIRVHLLVDGAEKTVTEFLPAGQGTAMIDLGPVTAGYHVLGVRAEGTVGGCNSGQLRSWGGELEIEFS